MTNPFNTSVTRQITRNGIDVKYVTVTEGTYNSDTGSVTNTEVETTIKAYPKNLIANQYNQPNLIGKTLTEWFVIASSLTSKPNPSDKIKVGSEVHTVLSMKDIVARNESVMYIITTVKA